MGAERAEQSLCTKSADALQKPEKRALLRGPGFESEADRTHCSFMAPGGPGYVRDRLTGSSNAAFIACLLKATEMAFRAKVQSSCGFFSEAQLPIFVE